MTPRFKAIGLSIGTAIGTVGAMFAPFAARADLTADITAVASTVGNGFQAGALTMLTQSLIYVIPTVILFLAVRYLWKKLKGAAH